MRGLTSGRRTALTAVAWIRDGVDCWLSNPLVIQLKKRARNLYGAWRSFSVDFIRGFFDYKKLVQIVNSLFAGCEFSLLLVIDPATWTFSYETGSSKTNTRANFLHKIESVSLYIYLLTHSPLSRPCGSLPSWRYYLAQRDNTASYAGYPWGSTSFLPLVTSSV